MEAVVLETLCYVNGFDASGFFEAADVENKFVSAAGVGVCVQDWVVRAQAGHDVVGVEEGDFGGMG